MLKNPNFTYDTFYLPFAQALLCSIKTKYIAIVFDGSVVVWWNRDYKEPIYLFTNVHKPIEEALYRYKKRFAFERFFSDQKGRGFHIHKSHIAKPERLGRPLIAAAIAYLFVIDLGIHAKLHDFQKTIHRTERCDLGMFK